MTEPKSYSRYSTYKKCPAKYNYAYNLKVPVERGPASPAMLRGSEIHKSVENYLNKLSEMLHPDIHKNYGQFFMGLRESYENHPELKFALDDDWQPCDFDDEHCMVRGFMDNVVDTGFEQPHLVQEYKTGKVYDDHEEQRSLYGMVDLIIADKWSSVDVHTIYFDKKKFVQVNYTRAMLPEYKGMWKRKFKEMDDDTVFITKPQYSCKWCEYSTHNGGPCPF